MTSFVVIALVPTVPYAVFNIGSPQEVATVFGLLLLVAAVMLLLLCLEMAVCHAILYLWGGQDLSKTVTSYAYPSLVRYALWWFPIANIGLGLYGLYLTIVGLSEYHGMSARKAGLAAIVGVVLGSPFILLLGGSILLPFLMDTSTQVGQPTP